MWQKKKLSSKQHMHSKNESFCRTKKPKRWAYGIDLLREIRTGDFQEDRNTEAENTSVTSSSKCPRILGRCLDRSHVTTLEPITHYHCSHWIDMESISFVAVILSICLELRTSSTASAWYPRSKESITKLHLHPSEEVCQKGYCCFLGEEKMGKDDHNYQNLPC